MPTRVSAAAAAPSAFFTLAPTSSLRVDTLARLRWMAVAGQLAATLVARFVFDFQFPWIACLVLIGASATLNLVLRRAMPTSRRLPVSTATALLAYDLAQLAGLLALTGGVQNPFSLLFIAPIAVSAASLPPRHSMGLFIFMTGLSAAISVWRLPMPWFASEPAPAWRGMMLVVNWLALVIGAGFIGVYSGLVAHEARQLSDALAAADLALERQAHLHQLDGVAAAAAHELGTPLGTIRLVTREWLNGEPPRADDLKLISDEADRCRSILKKLSSLRSDPMLQTLSLAQLIEEGVAPHRGLDVGVEVDMAGEGAEPTLRRNHALDYGLRNLIENAVDFAHAKVRVEARWSAERLSIRIVDDGPGFPADVLRQIGDPYLRSAREGRRVKDEGGLGLGLFIAKTLLERSGAAIAFGNAEGGGADARMIWRRADLELDSAPERMELSANWPKTS